MRNLGLSLTLALFAAGLTTASAFAGLHVNRGPSPGRGCDQLVTLKHPDLKGRARKAEWDKCMANPGGYNS